MLRIARGPVYWARRAATYSLRQSARLLMRVAPGLAAPFRSWGWLWQPTLGRNWQERFYRRGPDVYGFASNPYEAGKYAHTLLLLAGSFYAHGLEIGCSEGVFTAMLAPVCGALLAVDVSEIAVERARQRLRDIPQVTVTRAALPMEMPSGAFDLILCSDVLYYLPKDVLVELAPRLNETLAPGGTLLALHYLGNFGQSTRGDDVHEVLKARLGMEMTHDETVANVGLRSAGYRVTRFHMSAD